MELQNLPDIHFPRCYLPLDNDTATSESHMHVFCDASEPVYGAVACLQIKDEHNDNHVVFVMARSRIAPKRQLSIPRLELCAALSGAQLANLLSSELTIPIQSVTLWTDSTTVLTWLTSESCRYKVFVGTRIAEFQTMTDIKNWRYVDTKNNPADDITRGKTLLELSQRHRWSQGPPFLLLSSNCWPANPCAPPESEPVEELRKTMFCGTVMSAISNLPDPKKYSNWDDEGICCKGPKRRAPLRNSMPSKPKRPYQSVANYSPCLLNMTLILVSSEWEIDFEEWRHLIMKISIQLYWIQTIP